MRIVCQPTILTKYHALFFIFEKKKNTTKMCRLLQNIGGALRVKVTTSLYVASQRIQKALKAFSKI